MSTNNPLIISFFRVHNCNRTVSLKGGEEIFWNYLISTDLGPETDDEKRRHRKTIAPGLKELKNKMSGMYLFINCLWLILTFSLALVVTEVDENGNASKVAL